MFVDIISKNGNLLLNVGPMADGTIPEIQQRILLEFGRWLEINGEGVYGTRPWIKAEGKTLDNIEINFKITPRDLATDGGYASKDNLDDAKARGIINIVFNKVKGSMQNSASSKKMGTMLKK